jgi:hypothetical protein
LLTNYHRFCLLFRFAATLNVEHALAVLLDFHRTQDWFYSFRWLPPRFYKSRLKNAPFTLREEHVFFTHKMLSPDGFDSYNGTLSPKEYRAKYRENMDLAPKGKELQDPSKYANKERKEANLEKRYGFLIRD